METLVKMAPTKEEELKLRNFTGDLSKLGSAERFLKALLDIPFSFKRVDAMLYRANFESEINYLRKSFETLEVCWFTLHSSSYDKWLHMNFYIRHLLSTIACKVLLPVIKDVTSRVIWCQFLDCTTANVQNIVIIFCNKLFIHNRRLEQFIAYRSLAFSDCQLGTCT